MTRWLLCAVFLLAAVAALSAMQATTPRYAALTGPIVTSGLQGKAVADATFGVDVLKVVRAREIAVRSVGGITERQTQGIWVIVTSRVEARHETMPLRVAAIRGASGRLYQQSRRADGAGARISDFDLQPGLPAKGIFVFEMPQEETRDMTLILSSQLGPQLDSEIHVALDQNGIVTLDRADLTANG